MTEGARRREVPPSCAIPLLPPPEADPGGGHPGSENQQGTGGGGQQLTVGAGDPPLGEDDPLAGLHHRSLGAQELVPERDGAEVAHREVNGGVAESGCERAVGGAPHHGVQQRAGQAAVHHTQRVVVRLGGQAFELHASVLHVHPGEGSSARPWAGAGCCRPACRRGIPSRTSGGRCSRPTRGSVQLKVSVRSAGPVASMAIPSSMGTTCQLKLEEGGNPR